jgi:long-chain acyl-CoA synthetase
MTEPGTLPELLARRAAAAPEAVAMRRFTDSGVQEISWTQSLQRTCSMANALQRHGLGIGDVLVVAGPPTPEMFWAAYSAWAIGAAVVALWPGADADSIAKLALQAGARAIVVTGSRQAQWLEELVAIEARPPLVIDAAQPGSPAYSAPSVVPIAEFFSDGNDAAGLIRPEVSPSTIAALFRTSGSTGEPKSAAHTHASLIAGTRIFLAGFPVGHDDDHVPNFNLAAPAEPVVGTVNHLITGLRMNFSAAPLGYEQLVRKVSPVYLWTMPPTWQQRASAVRDALRNEPAVASTAALAAARQLLGAERTKWALTGGTALSADAIHSLQSIGLPLFKIYASAEMLITMSGLCDAAVTDGIGAPLPGVEADVDGSGQLRIRSSGLFAGYQGILGATSTLTADGWYMTGDAVWVDDSGEFRFLGRMSDLTRREDGTVMSPQLVESRLRDSRFISEAVAVSSPSGTSVLALIDVDADVLRAELGGADVHQDLYASPLAAELIDAAVSAANAGLPPDSRVSRYVCLKNSLSAERDELTATGKIRRAKVVEHYQHLIGELAGSITSGRPDVGRTVPP